MQPFSSTEIDKALLSLQKVSSKELNWSGILDFISASGHKPHKEWNITEESAEQLANLIGTPNDTHFQSMFQRVLGEGNWLNAVNAAESRSIITDTNDTSSASTFKPWVVLVTGVNGIRKTTSVYQPWFKTVLHQALGDSYTGSVEELPDGNDSFFRQLDFMIATLANEEFRNLYAITGLKEYSAAKANIFNRYRTLSEALGILLVKEAVKKKMNIMIETSGRDIAMFHYINHLFPTTTSTDSTTAAAAASEINTGNNRKDADNSSSSSGDSYRKLVIHFAINDLSHAERSVDARMLKEMKDGQSAAAAQAHASNNNVDGTNSKETVLEKVQAIINANAGGPYGSEVLKGVQTDSNAVWAIVSAAKNNNNSDNGGSGGAGTKRKHEDTDSSSEVARDWYKASILIEANAETDWCVRAVPSTSDSDSAAVPDKFTFIPKN